ncbi:MAG: ATP-binding protein [Chitinophagaceae bacterium]|nr:ATP-binding protein [Chitinophagaceae bacterium]
MKNNFQLHNQSKVMPIIKANEPLPESSVVIGVYGEPGVAKTTIANTAENPLLCDFDRGSRRSLFRKDTLVLTGWNDVINEEKAGTFKGYKTIIIDTAKAALDDFLMTYVVEKDFKLRTNKLGAYGAIGDEFKLFLNNRRNEGADVIIIAHAKKDEDTKKHIPDITGQSYNLMLRVCDQLGYVSMINNKRTIQFSPTDVTVGKNTATLPIMEIPDKSDPAITHFMADIISKTKESLSRQSEAQAEATAKSEKFQKEIAAVQNVDDLNSVLTVVQLLPKFLKDQLNKLIGDKAKEKGYKFNRDKVLFEDPAPAAVKSKTAPAEQEELNFQ